MRRSAILPGLGGVVTMMRLSQDFGFSRHPGQMRRLPGRRDGRIAARHGCNRQLLQWQGEGEAKEQEASKL
jgi:hypothetical protein